MSETTAIWIFAIGLLLPFYAYILYPLLLAAVGKRNKRAVPSFEAGWPRISITVPAYNEEAEISGTIESLLDLDYPADRREILVVSDASTDRTDDIVRSYAERGVRLLRMEKRSGKTAAENAAAAGLTGDIVVNTDASIRIERNSLKRLISVFADPEIGLASGRDISVSTLGEKVNPGESRYVSYEMTVRQLETRVYGIIGASGCFYAIREHLHRVRLQEGLSRDFAAALIARQYGYRSVSVDDAVCFVRRTSLLQREYQRKVRTMTRGMETLLALRAMLNPLEYGVFAWMLWSHKVCRWLVPWALLGAIAAILVIAPTHPVSLTVAIGGLTCLTLALVALLLPRNRPTPAVLAVPAYLMMGNLAALHASMRAVHGDRNAMWEPTRRETTAGTAT